MMTYCSVCKGPIVAGEKSDTFYVPVRPEHITRGHLGCVRQLKADARHEDLVPVVVGRPTRGGVYRWVYSRRTRRSASSPVGTTTSQSTCVHT
jgi:hypothetical protein